MTKLRPFQVGISIKDENYELDSLYGINWISSEWKYSFGYFFRLGNGDLEGSLPPDYY